MAVTPASMRALYPALADPPYSDALLNAWIAVAAAQVDPVRWGTSADMGVTLLAAHLATLALRQGSGGVAVTGTGGGAVSSKSVDKVSVAYDTSVGLTEGAGWYASTPFGNQYYYFMRIYGAGPVQVDPAPGGWFGQSTGVMWQ